jgi:hypothetical protein
MTRDQAKRQAAIHEAMAILCRQQADLDREVGFEACAVIAERSADDHARWQLDAEAMSCATH